ncbi:VCBS domain-containing protein [Aeromonas media]|uniref:VCBS domain-containing protein n=1 Tax=Aeromonas media TaxID=651 RepID=UPI001F1F873F|nr:VCBS domain-containing protein [Aeromonas media]
MTDDQGATTTQDVTITVTGTNDAPVISSAPRGEWSPKRGLPVALPIRQAAATSRTAWLQAARSRSATSIARIV